MTGCSTRTVICLLGLTLAVAGCGGSSGVTRGWSGSTIKSVGTPVLATERASGSLKVSGGAISITTSTGKFTSDGGPSGGVYTAANGDEAQVFDASLISQTYDHMIPLIVTVDVDGVNHVSQGVFGDISPADIMASSQVFGTATFNGEAAITSQNNVAGAVRHRSSDTVVTANFATGNVDVAMSSITPIAGAAATIDHVQITNATIAESGFSGGTATVSLGGVNALPAITSGGDVTSIDGHFFGTSGQLPDEVGGVLLVEGNTGSVSAVFVAD